MTVDLEHIYLSYSEAVNDLLSCLIASTFSTRANIKHYKLIKLRTHSIKNTFCQALIKPNHQNIFALMKTKAFQFFPCVIVGLSLFFLGWCSLNIYWTCPFSLISLGTEQHINFFSHFPPTFAMTAAFSFRIEHSTHIIYAWTLGNTYPVKEYWRPFSLSCLG